MNVKVNKPVISIVKYNINSYIIVEGNSSDSMYIVQYGKLEYVSESVVLYDNIEDRDYNTLTSGDFVDIISCMGRYPRSDSIVVVSDYAILIQVNRKDFLPLLYHNTFIFRKVILSFSFLLRELDNLSVTNEQSKSDNDDQIYHMAKFYFDQKMYAQAYYIYNRYIDNIKSGDQYNTAKESIEFILEQEDVDLSDYNKQDGVIRKLKSNSIIFCEHDKGDELFLIQKGKVKIVKVSDNIEKVIAILNSGDMFGEMALIEDKPRMATAVVLDDAELLSINRKNFDSIMRTKIDLSVRLIEILSKRLWITKRIIKLNHIPSPLIRMLDCLLLQLQKEYIKITKSSYTFNFSIKELIGLVNLDPSKCEEAIQYFNDNKKIFELDDKSIKCLDLLKLEKELRFLISVESRKNKKTK